MLSFFAVAAIVLCGVHGYLFFKLRHLFAGPLWQAALAIFLSAMLLLLLFRRRELYEYLPNFVTLLIFSWMGFILIAFICYLSADMAHLTLVLLKILRGPDLTRLLAPAHMTPLLLVLCMGLSVYSYFTAHDVQIKHFTIPSPKFAKGSAPLRIVALTDLHLGHTIGAKELETFIRLAKAQKPDLVVLAGDIVDADMNMRLQESAMLRGLAESGGVFAVLGNHDVYADPDNSRRFITHSGITLLEDSRIETCGINIVGMSDPAMAALDYSGPGDPLPLLKGADSSRFTLLLKHQPRVKDEEIGLFDLQISGHTHGGQIWPNKYIVQRIFGFRQGMNILENERGKSLLYLSNGTGYWGPPMRLGAAPEIDVFDIVPE